jgi:hypothetical protein
VLWVSLPLAQLCPDLTAYMTVRSPIPTMDRRDFFRYTFGDAHITKLVSAHVVTM